MWCTTIWRTTGLTGTCDLKFHPVCLSVTEHRGDRRTASAGAFLLGLVPGSKGFGPGFAGPIQFRQHTNFFVLARAQRRVKVVIIV